MGSRDVIAGVGRSFEAVGGRWKLDAGHYEGRDGTGDDLIPRRQTGLAPRRHDRVQPDLPQRGVPPGPERARTRRRFSRAFRHRLPQGVWAGFELGGETNHGPADDPGHLSYVRIGARYELPWTLTHIEADYRVRFGTISDHEVFVALQWVLDFKNPRRN